jgi:hypothetical protein
MGTKEERGDRPEDRRVEPLLAALGGEPPQKSTTRGKGSLRWKLVWVAIVLVALLALVIHQAF